MSVLKESELFDMDFSGYKSNMSSVNMGTEGLPEVLMLRSLQL